MYQSLNQWKSHVSPAITSKQDELKQYGYQVSRDDVWALAVKKAAAPSAEVAIHEAVRLVMAVKPHDYMNSETKAALKASVQMERSHGDGGIESLFQEVMTHSTEN
ncbi:ComN-like post-transcriptional regulator [Salsuginibacillus halophilus]|uniref:ComN-like post-transcriptional regulator n=1 Tax=Salsuginibacillus halophilus TaxID=517424 RepID=A0A2P8HFX1_9BACI|nr:post-transcriptional regulator [Salsuginibacillus halophilus]PSL45115.1 ComN-like post-transcriptional regulator [Salsuginibacillus halophilus]